jgi:hypothetical protein
MKLYAKQVPPEHQESPLFHAGSWPENVFVFGNRHFNQHAERLEEIRQALENIAETFDDMQAGQAHTNNLHAVLWYHLPRDDGRGYSRTERLELVKLAAQYEWPGSRNMENKILCRVLELITGQEWTAGTIRGYCQGDWQEIIYPSEYGREWLAAFEAEYFNTGSEWHIKESDEDPGYYQYCTGWNNAMIRAEIAEVAGCEPCDVVLLKFTGWSRTASYEEVTA